MPRSILRVLLVVLVAAAAAGGWFYVSRDKADTGLVAVNGRIEAIDVYVASKIAGKVTEVAVREGDAVKTGDLVARLDTTTLDAQRQQALAQVEQARSARATAAASIAQARSAVTLATQEIARTARLVQDGYATRQLLDQRQATLKSSTAALAAAEAQVHEADAAIKTAEAAVATIDTQIADSRIVAPVAGPVLYRLAEPGEVLAAGGRVVAIVDASDIYLTVFLPESTAGKVAVGDEARIRLDARPDVVLPARVTFVSPSAQFTPRQVETAEERQKLTFRAKLTIPAESLEAWVKPGMPGMGYVRTDRRQPWPATLPK